jgi:phosphatidylglycerophosphate synthase
MSNSENRRPLKSRDTGWARTLARACARAGLSPDAVSALSMVFAAIGCGLLVWSGSAAGWTRAALLIGAAVCVQLRLLSNLLDGMVAVEHGKGGPAGPIWNELPDRIADVLFLVGAGYGAALAGVWWAEAAGWTAAVLAVLTAYVRELGRGLGQPADFRGPMAKPHRMAALTALCALSAFEHLWSWRGETLAYGLSLIALGAALTALRRTGGLAARLGAQS